MGNVPCHGAELAELESSASEARHRAEDGCCRSSQLLAVDVAVQGWVVGAHAENESTNVAHGYMSRGKQSTKTS